MSYKVRLTWVGWCVILAMGLVNAAALALIVVHLLHLAPVLSVGDQVLQVPSSTNDTKVVILILGGLLGNAALWPWLLLCCRTVRNSEYY